MFDESFWILGSFAIGIVFVELNVQNCFIYCHFLTVITIYCESYALFYLTEIIVFRVQDKDGLISISDLACLHQKLGEPISDAEVCSLWTT